MNLFFAYALAVCQALNTLICALAAACVLLTLFLIFCCSQEKPGSTEYIRARNAARWILKCLLVLGVLWVLVPSQKRLNAMMLNYHAGCVDVRDEYGVRLGDK